MRYFVIMLAIVAALMTVWVLRDFIPLSQKETKKATEEVSVKEVKEIKKEETKASMVKNILKTSDGVNIAYDLYSVENPQKWFILIHMMPATKESWKDFAELAKSKGYGSLAIDLRGHGQSEGGPDGYKNFSDADHQKSLLDLKAAADFLKDKKIEPEKVILAGASIGANLALQFIVNYPEFKKAILLSPGLNYRGIETEPLAEGLREGQAVWYVAAEDDEKAGEMAKQLYNLTPRTVERRGTVFKQGGHGTEILKALPEVMEKLVEF